ncbi:MAG: hypothetical protein ACFCVE_08950 [Phycisphaerae bacterium]
MDGNVFRWGDKLSIQTPGGRELALVEQQVMSRGPTYDIYLGEQKVARGQEQLFTRLGSSCSIDDEAQSDPKMKGKLHTITSLRGRPGRDRPRLRAAGTSVVNGVSPRSVRPDGCAGCARCTPSRVTARSSRAPPWSCFAVGVVGWSWCAESRLSRWRRFRVSPGRV